MSEFRTERRWQKEIAVQVAKGAAAQQQCHRGVKAAAEIQQMRQRGRGHPLLEVQSWVDDPESRRWLGDRGWPEMILRLAAERAGGQGVIPPLA